MFLDTGNARPSSIPKPSLRVPPLKIKLPRLEKPVKPFVSTTPIDSKFQCLLKLDRIDLSLYNISNLPSSSTIKNKNSNASTTSFTITKPHEHHKPLKRLNNSETKKQSFPLSEVFKEKRPNNSISIRPSTSDAAISLTKKQTIKGSTSTSSMSSIYRTKLTTEKRIGLFEKENSLLLE